jgi:hypothetical protein
MRRCGLAIILSLTVVAGTSFAAVDEGVVLEVTTDTITLKGDKATTTYKVSNELLTNTVLPNRQGGYTSKFTDVAQGCTISVEYDTPGGGEPIVRLIKVVKRPEKGKEKNHGQVTLGALRLDASSRRAL